MSNAVKQQFLQDTVLKVNAIELYLNVTQNILTVSSSKLSSFTTTYKRVILTK